MHRVVIALVIVTAATASGTVRADDAEPEPTTAALAPVAGRFGYGLELQQQMRSASWRSASGLPLAAGTAPTLVMGVSVRTGERSRLAWQAPLAVAAPGALRDGVVQQRPTGMQFAWTLRSRDPAAAWRGSPFKYKLSGQTVVAVKPRRSRVSVTLQHEW